MRGTVTGKGSRLFVALSSPAFMRQTFLAFCANGRLGQPFAVFHPPRDHCHHLGRPLASGSCYLIHHVLIHSCPLGHRGCGRK